MATLPNLGNIHPLDKEVTYPFTDAYPTEGKVEILLASVPWNETNLPAFTSKEELDSFLDGLEGKRKLYIDQFENKPPAFTVPLGLSYTTALPYTYMRVRLVQPAPDLPLPGTNPTAKKDFYYFIHAINYRNPSTTYFDLTLDIWHTFFDDIEIVGDLKRGHIINELAPSPSEYLANPLAHIRYVTAPDFNMGDPGDQVAGTEIEPFGGTAKLWLVIWGNYPPRHLTLYRAATEHTTVPPEWNANDELSNQGTWTDTDYRGVTPIPYAPNGEGLLAPNGVYAYAITLDEAPAILTRMDAIGQHLLNRTLGAAVLPESLLNIGEAITTDFGVIHAIRQPEAPLSRHVTRSLTPEKWEMPSEVEEYAKAYTYPYAHLTVTMPDGSTRPIQTETLGGLGATYTERLSLAFPWIVGEVFLDGYKNDKAQTLEFRSLKDNQTETLIPSGAWQETLAKFNVPTFSLWRTSYTAFKADNAGAIQAARESAKTGYDNAHLAAVTGRDNTTRSLDTDLANTNASANTAYSNAATGANTGYANTTAASATSVSNQAISNNNATANTARNNVYIDSKTAAENSKQNKDLTALKAKASVDWWAARDMTNGTLNAEIDALQSNTQLNGITGVVGGATSGATTGAVAGPMGIAGGAIAGAISGAVQWGVSSAQTNIAISKSTTLAQLSQNFNDENYHNSFGGGAYYGYNNSAKDNAIELANSLASYTKSLNTDMNVNNVTAAAQIASNNQATTNANAARSRDASINIAANTRATTLSNAQATYQTGTANNTATYQTSTVQAKANYSAAFRNNHYAYNSSALAGNILESQNSGNAEIDVLAERNTSVSYVKQTEDALIQVAAMWKRYGYSYNGRTPRPLTPATSSATTSAPCTYWQIEEITFKKPLISMWQERLSALFAAGMTFWKEPLFTQTGE